MNLSLNNKLLPLTLIQWDAWISYLRKEVNYYIKDHIHYLKPLLESNLLYFVTRFYKNLEKPVRNFSCLHVFNIFPACAPPPPPNGSLSKNTGQYTKSRIMYKRLGPWFRFVLNPPPPQYHSPCPQYKCAKRVKVYHRLLFLYKSISLLLLMLVSSDDQNICLVQIHFVAGSL